MKLHGYVIVVAIISLDGLVQLSRPFIEKMLFQVVNRISENNSSSNPVLLIHEPVYMFRMDFTNIYYYFPTIKNSLIIIFIDILIELIKKKKIIIFLYEKIRKYFTILVRIYFSVYIFE